MNNKDLFNIIGNIDDKIINECSNPQNRRKNILKRIIAAAAIMAITVTGLTFGIPKLSSDGNISVDNEFGIVVKAENMEEKKIEMELNENEKIKLKEINIKDLITALGSSSPFRYIIENKDSYDESYFTNPKYTFEKTDNGYTVKFDEKFDENYVSAEFEINSNNEIDNIWNYMFEFVGKNIKTVTVEGETGEISYSQNQENVTINYLPLTSLRKYLEEKDFYKDDFSKLPKDELNFYVVFQDESTLSKKVELSWDKDGSLVAEMN